MYPPRRWPWVVGAVLAIAIAGAAIWYFAIRDSGSSNEVHGPAGTPFTVELPEGWKQAPADQLANLQGSPLAVLQKADGTGVVIVNSQAPTTASLEALSKRLEAKLKQKAPDFKLLGTKTINVQAGQAISITYARTKENTVNNLVVVPAGGHLYTLNAVVPSGQKVAAQQAADIINSFNA